jgi:carbonic anhydrase
MSQTGTSTTPAASSAVPNVEGNMKSKVSALFCLVGIACLLDIPLACGAQEVHPPHWGYSGHSSPKERYLLRTPAHLSDDQLKTFAKLYPRDNRPIQPLNHRTIQESN